MKESLRRLINTKFLVGTWICFHALIITAFLASIAVRGFNIDANFFNMLPDSTLGAAMGKADEKLSDNMEKSIFVLAGHEDFAKAREAAETAFNSLKDSDNFASISLYAENSAITEIEDFVAPYRWALLSEENINLLSTEEGAAEFVQNSLAQVYGSFTLTSLSNLAEDPEFSRFHSGSKHGPFRKGRSSGLTIRWKMVCNDSRHFERKGSRCRKQNKRRGHDLQGLRAT